MFAAHAGEKAPSSTQPTLFLLSYQPVSSNLASAGEEDVVCFQTMSFQPFRCFFAYSRNLLMVDPITPEMSRIHDANSLTQVVVFVKLASEWTRL